MMSTQHGAMSNAQRGFTMPAVIFGMIIMSAMTVAGLTLALDDKRSSESMRQSQEAFYVAETAVQATWGHWNDSTFTLDSLAKDLAWGATLDLGWDTLENGALYRAQITLVDSLGGGLYLLMMEGQDDVRRASHAIHTLFRGNPALYTLGGCCSAAAYIRGGVDLNARTAIDGTDTDPPTWDPAACAAYPSNTQPGLVLDEDGGAELLEISTAAYVASGDSMTNDESYFASPAIEEDVMDDSSFDIYGSRTFEELKAEATITLGDGTVGNEVYTYGGSPVSDADYDDLDIFGPRVHTMGDPHGHEPTDPLLGTCDYDHVRNFGAPSGPCANHFPVIFINGQVELVTQEYRACNNNPGCEQAATDEWYAQGLVILDTLDNGYGSEFELESPGNLNAVVVGKGCIELQDGSQTHGAIYLDGSYYDEDLCDGAPPLSTRDGGNTLHTDLYYSQCVVQKVLGATGFGDLIQGTGIGVLKLNSRYFADVLR